MFICVDGRFQILTQILDAIELLMVMEIFQHYSYFTSLFVCLWL